MRGKPCMTHPALSRRRITPADAGKTGGHVATVRDGVGSPPRMRGKPAVDSPKKIARRITPADAGKTAARTATADTGWDHPRGCGENQSLLLIHEHRVGSPPRMRGKPELSRQHRRKGRITPADAGKTVFGTDRRTAAEDHPRGCGENYVHFASCFTRPGSPPRMRGKRRQNGKSASSPGITPADAGKTKIFSAGSG